MLSYWDDSLELTERADGTQDKWIVADGTRTLMAGGSSDSLTLTGEIVIAEEEADMTGLDGALEAAAELAQAKAEEAQQALEKLQASQTAAEKTTITVSKKKYTVKKGKRVKISAVASDGSKLTYKSSNKKVAKVTSKGVIKGVKKGKATITIKANGVTRKVKVVVK